MKKRILSLALALALCLSLLPVGALAADYYFTDRNGVEMVASEDAWATRVVSFTPGSPWTSKTAQQDPQQILGQADWNGKYKDDSRGDMTMGAGGEIVLEFNILIYDGEGDDIYVFEVGEDVEATKVEVSKDLATWYEIGTAKGKTASVDLAGKVPEGARFRYVRLTDMKTAPRGTWPGADLDAVAALNIRPVTSDWAYSEIDEAEKIGLIPDILQGEDLKQDITRAEFAAVCVKTYEALSGTAAIPAVNNPFTDCNDVEVLKAYNIGAVNGTSATTYAPDALLTREQMATMLTRVFKKITLVGWTLATDHQFTLPYTKPAAFADDADISGYAKDSVYFMAANGIINGVGNNKFAPRNTTPEQEAAGYAQATREQALVIAVRMVKNLGE